MSPLRKKWICKLAIAAIVVFSYFGSAIAFRLWRMDPKNKYYGYYLPGASPIVSHTKEQSQKIDQAMCGEPTIIERIYLPAEIVLSFLGL